MKKKPKTIKLPSKLLTFLFITFGILFIYINTRAQTAPQTISPPQIQPKPSPRLQPIPHQFTSPNKRYLLTIISPAQFFSGTLNCPISLIDQSKGPLNLLSLPETVPCQAGHDDEIETPYKTWVDNQTLLFEPQPGNLTLILIPTDETYTHQYDPQQLYFASVDNQAKYWVFKNNQINKLHLYNLQHQPIQEIEFSSKELYTQTIYDPVNQGFIVITQTQNDTDIIKPTAYSTFYFINTQSTPPFPFTQIQQTPPIEVIGRSCEPATLESQPGSITLNGGCFPNPDSLNTTTPQITINL